MYGPPTGTRARWVKVTKVVEAGGAAKAAAKAARAGSVEQGCVVRVEDGVDGDGIGHAKECKDEGGGEHLDD